MRIYVFSILIIFTTLHSYAQQEHRSGCISCDEILHLQLPDVKIISAEEETSESTFCKVMGTIGKEINFELLLPKEWNQRFVMGGGGGFVGSIQNGARSKVNEGYATVGTDTGHKGSGIQADWALNNPERLLNFGHLAVHRTATVAKALINKYYCETPLYNYFMGCSRGGGQALIEAQRYPEDFDGIVCAAPVIDWPATGAEMIQNIKALYPDPADLSKATLSPGHIELLATEVMKQCDELDGVKDHILNDPRMCEINYEELPGCPNDQSGDHCFTKSQIEIVKTIYQGPLHRDSMLYPGFPPGSEEAEGGWMSWIVGPDKDLMQMNFPSLHYAFATEMFKYMVFNDPNWDYSKFDLRAFEEQTAHVASILNATSTDYSEFKALGNKMLVYHGWNDPALSAYTIIDHYEAAQEIDPEITDYIRLYLLPGVLHCGGGPGPSQADWLGLVRDWVENGEAPYEVIVSKNSDGAEEMTRPVYPYPVKAVYKGSGDINSAKNYKGSTP